MAVKNILNFITSLSERYATQMKTADSDIKKLEDFISSDFSEYSAEIIKKLQKKYGVQDISAFKKLAGEEIKFLKRMPVQKKFLDDIKTKLLHSNDAENIEDIKDVLIMIEKVPATTGMFGLKSGMKFEERVTEKNTKLLDIVLHDELLKHLQEIHKQLMEIYRLEVTQGDKIVWRHSFAFTKTDAEHPLEEHDDEILIPVLVGWQSWLMQLGSPGRAAREVTRGIGMPGHIHGEELTQEQFQELLKNMLKNATAYNEQQKTSIAQWVDANFTQQMNRFCDLLIEKGDLIDIKKMEVDTDRPLPPPGWLIQDKIDHCCYIENGKFFFEFESFGKAVTAPNSIVYMDPEHAFHHKNAYIKRQNMTTREEGELIDNLKLIQKKLPVLSRVRGIFCLEIDKNTQLVKPVMKDLLVVSYSDFLKSPERIYGHGKKIESTAKKSPSTRKTS